MHSAQLCGVSLIEERFRGDGAGRLDKGCLLSMGYKALAWGLIPMQGTDQSD